MLHISVNGEQIRQFEVSDLNKPSRFDRRRSFCGPMISTCAPLFDDIRDMDNHDFERKLRDAGVLRKNSQTDTESCEFWAYFSTAKAGEAFIKRLNSYLRMRASCIHTLRNL